MSIVTPEEARPALHPLRGQLPRSVFADPAPQWATVVFSAARGGEAVPVVVVPLEPGDDAPSLSDAVAALAGIADEPTRMLLLRRLVAEGEAAKQADAHAALLRDAVEAYRQDLVQRGEADAAAKLDVLLQEGLDEVLRAADAARDTEILHLRAELAEARRAHG